MAVNPYDPAQPTSSSQVELSAELRALKGVNVNHRDKIQELEDQIVPIIDMPAYMQDFVKATSADNALDKLGAGEMGKEVLGLETAEDIIDVLGLIDPRVQILTGGDKWTGTFAGGSLMFNIVKVSVPAEGINITWLTAFPNSIFGAWVTVIEDSSDSPWLENLTNAGCKVDHVSGGPHVMNIIAIGR